MRVALTYPRTKLGFLQWSQNVVNLITPAPGTWGLVVGDVTSYTASHTLYANAVAACDPSVRSKPAVVTLHQTRTNLQNAAALLANKIYACATVTDAMKVQIGMPPRATPMPIPRAFERAHD